MTNEIQLNILGSSTVQTTQGFARLYSKAVALMAYLALHGRTTRRTLAGLLWDGAPDGLNNVSVTRKHLIAELGNDVLISTPDSLELGSLVNCDAIQWLTDTTEQTVSLWRGDLLEGLKLREWQHGLGVEFQDWLEDTRRKHRTERLDRATRYAQKYLQRGDLLNARIWFEHAIQDSLDPREEASRCLILLHGLEGQTENAVRVFQELQITLQKALDIEPTSETRHALELARSGDVVACRKSLLLPTQVPMVSRNSSVPLIGRTTVMQRIHELFKKSSVHEIRAVLLTGEPGIGKTSLVNELKPGISLWQNYEITLLTDQPPLESIRQLAAQIAGEPETSQLMRETLASLLPNPSGLKIGIQDINNAVALKALQKHLKHHPTLLIVEDLHLCDVATLNWLTELMAQPPSSNLRILFSARPTNHQQPLENTVETWTTQFGLERIPLEPLTVEDLTLLVNHLEQTDVDVPRLRSMSGGNPLYALEWVRNQNHSARSVKDLIRSRVQGLASTARQTLEALAVLGGRADLTHISAVSGRSNLELIETLQMLEHLALVSLEDRLFTFNHDLTREVVYEDLAATRRVLLHLRAARTNRAIPHIAAPHFYASSALWTRTDAISARRAFDSMIERFALHGELVGASVWLERASDTADNDAERLRLHLRRADMLARHGQHSQALEALDTAQAWLRLVPDAVLHAQAAVIAARIYARERNDLERAQHFASTALLQVGGIRTQVAQVLKADALTLLGLVQQRRGNSSAALGQYHEALKIWQALGQQPRMAEALNCIAVIYANLQKYSEAAEVWLQALEIRTQLHDLIGMAAVNSNLCTLEWQCGRLETALDYNHTAESLYQEIGHQAEISRCFENQGAILFLQHRFQEALHAYQKAIENHLQHGLPIEAELHLNTAEALHRIGNLTKASENMLAFWEDVQRNARMRTALALYAHLLDADLSHEMNMPSTEQNHLLLAEQLALELGDETSSTEIRIRFAILEHNQVELEAMLTKHQSHPERAARLALALFQISGQTGPALNALRVTTNPWWTARLQVALKSHSTPLER